ncbi:MAG TPA: hypothetical protein VGN86_12940 [Pyrinomonadaceae bacterium]|jgi:hypothetical protein|nr:hypothetical protein [Pyrinomonadaceae bacterium]
MSSSLSLGQAPPVLCNTCGIPLDSQYFDDSSVEHAPKDVGGEVVLARFDLPAQYCGVLQYFSQFTDAFGESASAIKTPEIEWKLLVNNHALFPYINLRHIVNPWGLGSYPLNIRLDENSSIEFVARRIDPGGPINTVGGRIMGRFWYNACYGDVERGSY